LTSHLSISPEEAADRLAIRELIDAYADCADRRDVKGQLPLFTVDTRFLVFMDAAAAEPTQQLNGRESLAPVFENLNDRVHPLSRRIRQAERSVALLRAQADGQLDRNEAVRDLTTRPGPPHSWSLRCSWSMLARNV
jgi:hypothetical protein